MSLHLALVGPCQVVTRTFHRIEHRLCTRARPASSKQQQRALHTCLLLAPVTMSFFLSLSLGEVHVPFAIFFFVTQ